MYENEQDYHGLISGGAALNCATSFQNQGSAQLRLEALRIAAVKDEGGDPAKTVRRAQAYYAFLIGMEDLKPSSCV